MSDSVAARLAVVDVKAAKADATRFAYEGLCSQAEAARLAMEADRAALTEARREVVDLLIALGHAVYLTNPDGSRRLVELFRGDFREEPLADGTAPIPK